MSSPSSSTLQQLHRLNRSSPDFHDQLCNVLYGEEYVQCVPNIEGEDLVWLVDYLDKVNRCVAPPHSLLKPAQALDGLDPPSPASRKCLRELRSRCGTGAILPTSYTLSPDLLSIAPEPFASGGFGDVYKGTLNGSRVCIKRARVYTRDPPKKAIKVCYWRYRFACPPSLTKDAGLLPRGRNVETLNPPKRPTPPGCHYRSPPARFGLDVRRRSTGIHGEAPQCGPTQTRGCPFCRVYPTLTPVASCLTSLMAFVISTPAT